MPSLLSLFVAVFVGTYALSRCPLFADSDCTTYGLYTLAALTVAMFIERMELIAPVFSPRSKYKKSAVFVVGADQCVGWQLITRCSTREMAIYAAVEDLQSPQADWLRRHLHRDITLVRLDPRSDKDAVAAAQLVQDTIGDKHLVGVVYAGYLAPKEAETLDLNDVHRGIEIHALGAVRIAEAFASLLQKQNGRFVIVADMAGRIVLPSLVSYCMTQAVILQFAEIIRNNLKKYDVSTHVVQPLLHYYRKTQEKTSYPETDDDGKIVVESNVDGPDLRGFRTVMYVFEALLSNSPKALYIPTYYEKCVDMLIRYSPSCVYDSVVNNYFTTLTKQK